MWATFLDALKSALKSMEGVVRRVHAWLIARRLDSDPSFAFTADYVSTHTSIWEEHLATFRARPGTRMLEIGSFEGRSAVWFLDNILTDPSASITCLDMWWNPVTRVRFDHNIEVARAGDRVRRVNARSAEGLLTLESERFDIVYVDGSHRAADVLMDAILAFPLLHPGGAMMFDDYEWRPDLPPVERPKLAIDHFLSLIDGQYELLHRAYQVIIRKQPARITSA